MKMKKLMAVLCAMLMICALAACGDDSSKNNNNQQAGNDGPSAYELYTQASEKMAALDSAEYDMIIDLTMAEATSGESYDMSMTGKMIQVKTGEADTDFNLAFNMNMDMSAMGAGTMDINMYYTDGYLYYDMGALGQFKAAMDIAAAEEAMNSESMAEIEESWIKESSVNGNDVHLVVDGSMMSDYVDQAASMTGGLAGGANIGDVTIDMTIDAEGLPVSYKMTLPMTISAEGMTMTMDMDMTMNVIATGDAVVINFPEGMESFMEVDASQLGL